MTLSVLCRSHFLFVVACTACSAPGGVCLIPEARFDDSQETPPPYHQSAQQFQTRTPQRLNLSRCYKTLVAEHDYGTCAFVTRFTWSATFQRCQPFLGCVPPDADVSNNFDTLKKCQDTCRRARYLPPTTTRANRRRLYKTTTTPAFATPPPECTVPVLRGIDYGNCRGANSTRYFWSYAASACLPFTGCSVRGRNNWRSRYECERNCAVGIITKRPTTTLAVPFCADKLIEGIDFGACGSMKRFRYNAAEFRCYEFLGCDPRETLDDYELLSGSNNFDTLQQCRETCMVGYRTTTLPDILE